MTENQDNAPRPTDDQTLGAALGRAIGRRWESLNRVPPIADVLERSAAAARARRIRRTLVGVAAAAALLAGGLIAGNTLGDDGDGTVRVATEPTVDATTADLQPAAPRAADPQPLEQPAAETAGGAKEPVGESTDPFPDVPTPESRPTGPTSTWIEADLHAGPSPTETSIEQATEPAAGPESIAAAPSFDPIAVIAAGKDHSCAIRADSTIVCWGANSYGQLDAPSGSFTAIAAGWDHSCAIRADSTIGCWGYNGDGQADSPAGIFTAVAVGNNHSCGLQTDDAVICWGDNGWGQTEPSIGDITAIAAGWDHSCALRTRIPTIWCWGYGYSTRGDVAFSRADVPREGTFTSITSGRDHSCALRTDNTIICWREYSSSQTDPPAGTYTAISAGSHHSCALRTDDTVVCWGNNEYGQTDVPADI